jgi:twinkle protein
MSEFVKHVPCGSCGSSDANSLYDDGHTHCFACGVTVFDDDTIPQTNGGPRMSGDFLTGEFMALPKRGLDEETCRKMGYRVGRDKRGNPVQIADYRNGDGVLVAQKIRGQDKTFNVVGGGKDMPLFGQHLWPASGRRVVVTEGEIDALSVAQACGLSWPVVSLPNGAQSAKRSIQRALEWLCGFETVVLAFDMDDPGRAAAAECAPLFPPGKCAIAELPRKDANEMLVAGQVKELASSLWNARTYRPDGIVTPRDIRSRVLSPPVVGLPYCIESLNQYTYGRRIGDVIGFGAGTGIGKTDLMTQQIEFDVNTLGLTTGLLYLEQDVGETGKRIAGKMAGKRFHVPDGSWQQSELDTAWDTLEAKNKLYLYDSFGTMSWDRIREKIRYMIYSLGCQSIYLDHMTALVAGEEDERKTLDAIMGEVAGLAKGNCVFHYVSHLATPEGKSHEAGGRVEGKHFRGSRALQFWSYFMWGIERDKLNKDPSVRSRTTIRNIKDRYTGDCDGRTFRLEYDRETGRLIDKGEFQEGADSGDHGFKDESSSDF